MKDWSGSPIVGIDPGWSGGIALLQMDGTFWEARSFAGKTEADIIEDVRALATGAPRIVYLERVHSMPGQGVSACFKFGWIYGLLRGLVIGSSRVIDVTPQAWQKALGCLTKGDKNISKAKAQGLFPGVKVTHHVADALCISYFGYLKERGRI